MRIVITGTWSVGKTTLASDLHEATSIDIVEEHARDVLEAFTVEQLASVEYRWYLTMAQVVREELAAKNAASTLVDAGLPSVLAYNALFNHQLIDYETLSGLGWGGYDCAILCDPTGVDLVDDGKRGLDMNRRANHHGLVMDNLAHLDLPVHPVSGDRAERLESVLSILELSS